MKKHIHSEVWRKRPCKKEKKKKKRRRMEKEKQREKGNAKAGRRLQITLQWEHCNLLILVFDTCAVLNTARAKGSLLQKKKKLKYLISTEKGQNIANMPSYCLLYYIQSEYIKSSYYYHYFIWITIAPVVQGIISRDSISASEDSESKIASGIHRRNGRILKYTLSNSKCWLLPLANYLAKI